MQSIKKIFFNQFLLYTLFLFFSIGCNNDSEQKLKATQLKLDSIARKQYVDSLIQINLKLRDSIALPQHTSLANKYAELRKSVFMIYCTKPDGTSQGSAFLINNNAGICISNYHVFENATESYAIDFDGNRHEVKSILKTDPSTDYVVFSIDDVKSFPTIIVAKNKLAIGDDCFAIGNPKGLQQTLSTGIVSGYRQDDKVIQTTTSFTHGSSGGPLFNSNGEVIGITTSIYEGEGNLNFALNIIELPIEKFIQNSGNNNPAIVQNSPSIPTTIHQFILAEEERDFNKITSCFSSNIEQYWDLLNPTTEQLLKVYESRWAKMNDAKNVIKQCKKINENTYELTIDFSFFSKKDTITKTIYNTKVRYELDANNKINKVYGVK